MKKLFDIIDTPRRAWKLVVACGFIVRFVIWFGQTGVIWPDSVAYYKFGLSIAQNWNFDSYPIYRTPLYPMFLAIFLSFGESLTIGRAIVTAQLLVGLGTVVLFYFAALRATSTRVAFFAALLFSLHSLQIFYEFVLQTEVLFIFLLWLFIFLAFKLFETLSAHTALVCGVAAGACALTRPVGQLLPLLLIAALCFSGAGRKIVVRNAACIVLAFALVVTPWMYWNSVSKGFFGLSREMGLATYHRIIDVDQLKPPRDEVSKPMQKALDRFSHSGTVSYFTVWHYLQRQNFSEKEIDQMMYETSFSALRANLTEFLQNSAEIWLRLFFKARDSVTLCRGEGIVILCSGLPVFPLQSFILPNYEGPKWSFSFIDFYFTKLLLPMGILAGLAWARLLLRLTHQGKGGSDARAKCLLLAGLLMYFSLLTALFNREEDRFRLPIDAITIMYAMEGVAAALWGSKLGGPAPLAGIQRRS